MATDADNVLIAGTGAVHVAPVGTAGPTDIATALNAAFKEVGFTSEDGVTISPSQEVNEIRAWQSQYPIRRSVTSRALDIAFTALEWTQETVKMTFGGGTFATTAGPPAFYTYTPPSAAALYERALVLQFEDGTNITRLHVPRVMVSEVGEIQLVREDAAGLPITLALMAESAVTPFTLISNAPQFAAA